jgi:spermidine/putrescine transport system substrate-binding protein
MKRFIYFVVVALVLVLAGCSSDRDNILKVYNWADYIDEELLVEFEQWHLSIGHCREYQSQ